VQTETSLTLKTGDIADTRLVGFSLRLIFGRINPDLLLVRVYLSAMSPVWTLFRRALTKVADSNKRIA
jgi:hypothetical protein